SNGTGYQPLETWSPGVTIASDSGGRFADFNGDGRVDFITWMNSDAEPMRYFVAFSTGSGYTAPYTWYGPKLIGGSWPPDYMDFQDMNGDGRADLVLTKGATQRIYLDKYPTLSAGFDAPIEATIATPMTGGVFADVNGDSLPDYVQVPTDGTHVPVNLWTGKA